MGLLRRAGGGVTVTHPTASHLDACETVTGDHGGRRHHLSYNKLRTSVQIQFAWYLVVGSKSVLKFDGRGFPLYKGPAG